MYHARKPRILRRIPAQPIREVKRPMMAVSVERISSGAFPVRMTYDFSPSNHVSRQTDDESDKRVEHELYDLKRVKIQGSCETIPKSW